MPLRQQRVIQVRPVVRYGAVLACFAGWIVDLGAVGHFIKLVLWVQREDEDWYRFSTNYEGTVNIDAVFDNDEGDIDLEVYNAMQQRIASSRSKTDNESIEMQVRAGPRLYLRVYLDRDLQLRNLCSKYALSLSGPPLSLFDSDTDDDVDLIDYGAFQDEFTGPR